MEYYMGIEVELEKEKEGHWLLICLSMCQDLFIIVNPYNKPLVF